MAQAGFTPFTLYASGTASSVPLAADLANGELALNYADGKIFYKNSSGVVTNFTAGSGGSVTNVSWTGGIVSVANSSTTPSLTIAGTSGGLPYFNSTSTWASSGVLTANGVVLGGGAGGSPTSTGAGTTGQTLVASTGLAPAWGTLGVAGGGTGQIAYAVGDILYASATGALSKLVVGSAGQVLTVNGAGTLPVWQSAAGTVSSVGFTGGIIGVATATTTPALSVTGNSGGIVYFSGATAWGSSGTLTANALMIGGGVGVSPSTVTTGTGVITALGINVGTAGSVLTNGGALGTPASGTVTNLTGTASININGTVGATTASAGTFTNISYSGQLTSTVAIGTAPFVVTSTTAVANLVASNISGSLAVSQGGTGATSTTGSGANVLGTRPTLTLTTAGLTLQDSTDNTKQAVFSLAGNSTSTIRTYTYPNFDGTFATLAGTETFTNKTITTPTITVPIVSGYTETTVAIGNSGTTQTLSITAGTFQTITMTGNCVFTMPSLNSGKSFTLITLQDSTGSRTALFTAVKWAGGSVPVLTPTASTGRDIFTFVSDGINWYGAVASNF